MSDFLTRQAEAKYINAIANDTSVYRDSNITLARSTLESARRHEASDDAARARYKALNSPSNVNSYTLEGGDSAGAGGGFLFLIIAGVCFFLVGIVYQAYLWTMAHIWNIIGTGMLVAGFAGLYFLASYLIKNRHRV